MSWTKLGLVYEPDPSAPWMASGYTHLPTPLRIWKSDIIRVYFAGLDLDMYGRIGYVDLDARTLAVLSVSPDPVFHLGSLGSFDDCGVVPSCVIRVGHVLWMYYIGFQRAERVPYMLFTGLAASADGGERFMRSSEIPILDRTAAQPYSRSAPFVLDEGDCWRMYYWSCTHWTPDEPRPRYHNNIYSLESMRLDSWGNSTPHLCLTPEGEEDYAVGRPSVVHDEDGWKMWYSIRSTAPGQDYRIAYAESADGLSWCTVEEPGAVEPSEEGWDSGMVCYPYVIDIDGRRLMFYNGNQHGKTGFGVAEWRD